MRHTGIEVHATGVGATAFRGEVMIEIEMLRGMRTQLRTKMRSIATALSRVLALGLGIRVPA